MSDSNFPREGPGNIESGKLQLQFGEHPLRRKTPTFWTKVTGLMGLGSLVNVALLLARFLFYSGRYLILFPLGFLYDFSFISS